MIKNIYIVEKKETTITDFIKFWELIYDNFNTNIKFPDKEFYSTNIGIKGNTLFPLTTDNIESLFRWKLGKEKLYQHEINIIENIKNNLEKLNEFRTISKPDWGSFEVFYQNTALSCFKTKAPVLSIFIVHIAHPFKYPIIDQHVIRAYKYLNEGDKSEVNPDNYLKIYKNYTKFFNELSTESGLPFRNVDKALWAFGKFLKNKGFRNLIF